MNNNTSLNEKQTLTATMKLANGPEKQRFLQMYRQYALACETTFALVNKWRTSEEKYERLAFEELATNSSTPHMRSVVAAFFKPDTKNAQVLKMKSPKALVKTGVFPLSIFTEEYDFTCPGYKCSVAYEPLKRINSWIESNKLTQTFYKEKSDRFIELGKLFEEKYSTESLHSFISFYMKVTREMNGRLNQKFFGFFHFQLRESLVKNIPLYKGRWLDSKQRRRIYVVNDNKIVDLLQTIPVLWKEENCILNDENICEYIELYEGLFGFDNEGKDGNGRWKKEARLTPPNIFSSPIRLELGFHYVNPKNLSTNKDNKTISFQLSLPRRKDGTETTPLNLVWNYGKGHEKKCMLENLEFKYNGDKTGNYTFNFLHNGKLPIEAIISQMSVKLVIHNEKMDFNNPKDSDYDFVLYLPYGYEVKTQCGLPVNELKKMGYSLRKSFPQIQKRKNQKNVDPEPFVEIPDGTVFVAADLGINPLVNVSVFKKTRNGYEIIEENTVQTKNQEVFNKYKKLIEQFSNVKKLLNQTTDFLTFDVTKEEGLTPESVFDVELFNELNSYLGLDYVPFQYILWLNRHKNVTPHNKWHNKENKWYLSNACFLLYEKYLKFAKDRAMSNDAEDVCLSLKWVELMDARKSATSAIKNYGHVRKLGQFTKNGYFVEEMERSDNIKDDFCKKISRQIFDFTIKYKSSFVLVEQFVGRCSDKFNTKKENQQFQTWIVGQLKERIFVDGQKFGVAVIEVDERHTSQIHAETGTWGYRDEKNTGILKTNTAAGDVNCHFNSNKNFFNRAISHHTNLRSLEFVQGKNGVWTASSSLTNKEIDKREKGLLSFHYGYYNICFVEKDGKLVVDKNTEWSHSLFKTIIKKQTMYVMNDEYKEWVTKDEKNAFVDSLASTTVPDTLTMSARQTETSVVK